MRRLFACLVIGLIGISPALAFDTGTQGVLDRMKIGKPVPITDIATLMRSSARWCYAEDEGSCSWSDIYLEVTDTGATYEIGNAWDADYDVIFTDHGTFEEGRYICETGYDWVPTLRAVKRADGTALNGRPLWDLKTQIGSGRSEGIDCFDYVLKGSDSAAETITLLQRQFTQGVTDPINDVTVTLHFNAKTAAALSWYY
ncbi:hypothetical protein ASD83_16135 [Devosia sp. Root685]|uniref:hypothetical protein n=1 Tax=Devosia sp. Root685 TaxID=1736587 RepID=UPI0006F8A39F|nr:hypothetical protein [Devosia sp. Root685]KRA96623.1 hypothetical protein ASD83_16135 [Devosia sp. Root685]